MTTALLIALAALLIPLALAVLLFKFLGCTAVSCLSNIIAGGALYWFLDAFHIVKMEWTILDGILVALLGIPGTILIALYRLIF